MLNATIKGLLAHKVRLALTMLSIVLGVGFVAGTLIYTDTINLAFDNLFAEAFAGVDVNVRAAQDEDLGFVQAGRMPEELLADVSSVPGVAEAWGNVFGYAQFVAANPDTGEPEAVSGGGVSLGFSFPDTERPTATRIIEGRRPESDVEVVMDVGTANRYGFQLGDEVQVLFAANTGTFTVVGIAGLGESGEPGGFTGAFFDLTTAQQVLDAVGEFDSIEVVAATSVDADQLASDINEVLPPDVEAVTAQTAAEEQADSIKEALGFFNIFLLVFAGIAIFVGTFIIQNTFRIIVAQRTRELALLRAIGASGNQVTRLVLGEAVVVGIVGSVLGVVTGIGLALILRAALEGLGIAFPSAPTQLQVRTVLVALLVGVGVTLLSAVIPARKAASVSPLAALATVDVQPARGSLRRRVTAGAVLAIGGAGLMAMGLFAPVSDIGITPIAVVGLGVVSFFVGVAVLSPAFARPVTAFIGAPLPAMAGVSGNLARENSMRSPRRTSATAAALMVGLALVALVAIIAESLRSTVSDVLAESFLADFVVQPANPFAPPGGLPTAMADDVAGLEEVSDVSRVRFSQAKLEDSVVFLGAIESNYTSMFELDVTEGTLTGFSGNETAVLRGWAEGQALGLGDEVIMQFAATGNDLFRIVAVYEEETAGTLLIPLDAYEANFVEQLDASVYVLLAPGVSAEAGRAALEVVTAEYPSAAVLDATGFQEQTEAALDQLLNVFVGLLSLAILISILGITNTLSLSVIERTREIGLLRAIGMSRRQVRRVIRWEAVITSVFGAVLGVAIGILFSWSIVQALEDQGIRFTIPFVQLLLLVVAAGLAGVLAAIPPASRASKLDVLEAIAYE